jgi:hypothetical protein
MLIKSQPMNLGIEDDEETEALGPKELNELEQMLENGEIVSQNMEGPWDDKPSWKLRMYWKWREVRSVFTHLKWLFRNHIKWNKTLGHLRPWEGFAGLIDVVQTHLWDYIEQEEKYWSSSKECKDQKIASAKETIELLERMVNPDGYWDKRREEEEIKKKYPEQHSLYTEYENGGFDSSGGGFVAQGNGWVGRDGEEEGYFEFVDGRFKLIASPDQRETERLLAELDQYDLEIEGVYKQSEADSDKDFERLGQLLKDNLYSWWD